MAAETTPDTVSAWVKLGKVVAGTRRKPQMTTPTYTSRRDIWLHLMLYPGHTLTTAVAPILVGTGLAIHDGVFALWPAVTAFLCSWLVHVGGVFVDQYQLLVRYPTVREHPELNDAVAEGWLRLPFLRGVTAAWFGAALIPGVYLLWVVGPSAILLGLIGVIAAAWYGAGQPSMAKMGLADPVFFVMFGVVAAPATYYVQAIACHAPHVLPLSAFLVGLPTAGLVTNVLVIDDIRDVEFDRAKGWSTTPVRLGKAWSRREHTLWTALAAIAPLALAWRWGPWMLAPWVTLPFAWAANRAVRTHEVREPLIPWTPRSAFLAMGYSALVGLGLAMSA